MADPSTLSRGVAGFSVWVDAEARADAAKDIPDGEWDQVLPSLLREIHDVGAGELESVGKTWADEDAKLAGSVAVGLDRFGCANSRLASYQEDLTELELELKKYFDEAARTGTHDDDYRRFEGLFSLKTIGFWTLLAILALGELPLTHKAYARLEAHPTAALWLAAFATGCALVGAGHFVGTKSRRLISLAEREKEFEKQIKMYGARTEERKAWALVEEDLPPKPKYPTEQPAGTYKLKHRWALVGMITLFALAACGALGVLRTDQVKSELLADVARQCALRAESSGASDFTTDTAAQSEKLDVCQATLAREYNSSGFTEKNIVLFSILQGLIFAVAASLTYHRHDEFAEAVRTLRAKIIYVEWRRRFAEMVSARRQGTLDKAAAIREARFRSRVGDVKARRNQYQSLIFRAQSIYNRERPSGPLVEIAAQRPLVLDLPAWVLASYPLPGRPADFLKGVYTVSLARLLPEQPADHPLIGRDVELRPEWRGPSVPVADVSEPDVSEPDVSEPDPAVDEPGVADAGGPTPGEDQNVRDDDGVPDDAAPEDAAFDDEAGDEEVVDTANRSGPRPGSYASTKLVPVSIDDGVLVSSSAPGGADA